MHISKAHCTRSSVRPKEAGGLPAQWNVAGLAPFGKVQPRSAVRQARCPPGTGSAVCHSVSIAAEAGVAQQDHGAKTQSPAEDIDVENVDVAVLGGDLASLILAYAITRAQPDAKVKVYARESFYMPVGGGAMVHKNGLAAMKAIDPELYNEVMHHYSSPVKDVFMYDQTAELRKQTSLQAKKRRSVRRKPVPPHEDTTSPRMVNLDDVRRLMLASFPPGTVCYSHEIKTFTPPSHVGPSLIKLEAAAPPEAAPAGLAAAIAAEGPKRPVYVKAKLVIGAEAFVSAPLKAAKFASAANPLVLGRLLWRGRVSLRRYAEDPARMRKFTTAMRMFVDLSCPPGEERIATISPAGPDTFVWSASCPVALLPGRGLTSTHVAGVGKPVNGAAVSAVAAGASTPYSRVQALFEDFPQDFWSTMKLTREGDVVEEQCLRQPLADMDEASWANSSTALAAGAVHILPPDDPTAFSLAMEDAAVLGWCLEQQGITHEALALYAKMRAPRVRSLLTMAPNSPERQRLVDEAHFEELGNGPVAATADDLSTVDTAVVAVADAMAVPAVVDEAAVPVLAASEASPAAVQAAVPDTAALPVAQTAPVAAADKPVQESSATAAAVGVQPAAITAADAEASVVPDTASLHQGQQQPPQVVIQEPEQSASTPEVVPTASTLQVLPAVSAASPGIWPTAQAIDTLAVAEDAQSSTTGAASTAPAATSIPEVWRVLLEGPAALSSTANVLAPSGLMAAALVPGSADMNDNRQKINALWRAMLSPAPPAVAPAAAAAAAAPVSHASPSKPVPLPKPARPVVANTVVLPKPIPITKSAPAPTSQQPQSKASSQDKQQQGHTAAQQGKRTKAVPTQGQAAAGTQQSGSKNNNTNNSSSGSSGGGGSAPSPRGKRSSNKAHTKNGSGNSSEQGGAAKSSKAGSPSSSPSSSSSSPNSSNRRKSAASMASSTAAAVATAAVCHLNQVQSFWGTLDDLGLSSTY